MDGPLEIEHFYHGRVEDRVKHVACKIYEFNNAYKKPSVNFMNILQAAFTCADPESAKKDSQVVSLFCAFGICGRKSCL